MKEKCKDNNGILQMDWMIAFVMEIAVSVCRLTVYGSVNGVSVANFHQCI